ncbi:MAG: BON domain-containing protein [Desulfovibrio sp.]|nr:BON domain-containing protein [Desulfovibrio sp.]
MQKSAFLLLLFWVITLLNGCAYSVYDDQRLMGTMSSDKKIATKIKAALLNESFVGGWEIAVYCFYGHVFLVGEVPANMQQKALTIARRYKPRSVTSHWFAKAKSDTANFALATRLRSSLIGTAGLSSTRIETEVNSGRVVLLGVVRDMQEKQLAIDAARKVQGVTSVTSYLMLPQKAGQIDDFPEVQVKGTMPKGGGYASPVSAVVPPAHDGGVVVESDNLP